MSSNLKNFEIIQELGKGSFGSVFKVKRISDGNIYAMKKVLLKNLTPKEKENALNEIRILASVNSSNVVSYKEAFYDEESQTLCMVMDFLDDGDLELKVNHNLKFKQHFTESEIWSYFKQIVLGLKALHEKKILHRDLKCANVFITKKGVVKIGDMNVSKVAKTGLVSTQTGTPYYASPEVWKDKPYDYKSDLWSLGCILYEMCVLKPPFTGRSMEEVYSKVIKGTYPSIPVYYSNELKNMIANLLKVNPLLRPDTDAIIHMLDSLGSSNKREENIDIMLTTNNIESSSMLKTLKIPRQMKDLNKLLPKSKYPIDRKVQSSHTNRNLFNIKESNSTSNSNVESSPSPENRNIITKVQDNKIIKKETNNNNNNIMYNKNRRRLVPIYKCYDVGNKKISNEKKSNNSLLSNEHVITENANNSPMCYNKLEENSKGILNPGMMRMRNKENSDKEILVMPVNKHLININNKKSSGNNSNNNSMNSNSNSDTIQETDPSSQGNVKKMNIKTRIVSAQCGNENLKSKYDCANDIFSTELVLPPVGSQNNMSRIIATNNHQFNELNSISALKQKMYNNNRIITSSKPYAGNVNMNAGNNGSNRIPPNDSKGVFDISANTHNQMKELEKNVYEKYLINNPYIPQYNKIEQFYKNCPISIPKISVIPDYIPEGDSMKWK